MRKSLTAQVERVKRHRLTNTEYLLGFLQGQLHGLEKFDVMIDKIRGRSDHVATAVWYEWSENSTNPEFQRGFEKFDVMIDKISGRHDHVATADGYKWSENSTSPEFQQGFRQGQLQALRELLEKLEAA